ncbi:Zn-dependent hydrolase [Paenibacillus solisilvae]|uniref:Zn-dependent hydrolase n=1 Tax=Paenibacillus solisilvae TaxID=2486751 RepID=A0ABW0VVQ0_9BACL
MSESHASPFVSFKAEWIGLEAERRLVRLSQYGADDRGGVTRLLYSASWIDAQQALAAQMAEDGLEVRLDSVGNLYGRLQGEAENEGVIVTGSHLDTVVGGGKYDGAFGIVAGMMALRSLKERYGRPRRSIEVVSLCEEEGSRFPLTCWGSGRILGSYSSAIAATIEDGDGITLQAAMQEAGFANEEKEPIRSDIAAFVELHIEQGGRLEDEGLSIGIVDRIVAQKRATVTVRGRSNHAGTTPMHLRKDALAAAVEMIEKLYRKVNEEGGPLVATVGFMKLVPNTPNVIPEQVTFTVDMRHPDDFVLDNCFAACKAEFNASASRLGLSLNMDLWMDSKSVAMNASLQGLLREQCDRSGVRWRTMASGAGHDAQLFAPFYPTALLFVPSRGGISHSEHEYTSPEELGTGIERLTELLYELGYRNREGNAS